MPTSLFIVSQHCVDARVPHVALWEQVPAQGHMATEGTLACASAGSQGFGQYLNPEAWLQTEASVLHYISRVQLALARAWLLGDALLMHFPHLGRKVLTDFHIHSISITGP